MKGYAMSVPANLRSVPKLEVLKNARQLVIHTIKIVTNEKNFPKRYRWCFTNKLIDETISMYKNLIMANSINVRAKDDKQLRRRYQTEALSQIYGILSYIHISYELFGLSESKIRYWVMIAEEEKVLIRKWRDSDADRYRNI